MSKSIEHKTDEEEYLTKFRPKSHLSYYKDAFHQENLIRSRHIAWLESLHGKIKRSKHD